MKCTNIERKCEWEGTVGTLMKHTVKCPFTPVSCPNECKDDNGLINHFMRKDMGKHLTEYCPNRDYECQYCGEKGTYTEIINTHHMICVKKIVFCPNAGCMKFMERQEVEEHRRSVCGYTVVPCKYEIIGCRMKSKRRDMAAHEESNKQMHLNMAMDTTVELTKALIQMASKQHWQETTALKMQGFHHYKICDKKFISRPFYSAPRGYQIAITVYANGYRDGKGTHISVFAGIREGKYDEELGWPFAGEITIKLLNQLEDKNHHTKIVYVTPESDLRELARGFNKFIPNCELGHDPIKNTQYLKDNTLYFRVAVERADCKPWLTN